MKFFIILTKFEYILNLLSHIINRIISASNINQQYCIVWIQPTMYKSRFKLDVAIKFVTPNGLSLLYEHSYLATLVKRNARNILKRNLLPIKKLWQVKKDGQIFRCQALLWPVLRYVCWIFSVFIEKVPHKIPQFQPH